MRARHSSGAAMAGAADRAVRDERPQRFGLAAKLFAILLLLGAVAVLITGVLGYIRARDALEKTIFDQLTSARETKTRQVETYFRGIRNEMRLLAASKMVVDAMRGFRTAVEELDARPAPDDICGRKSTAGTMREIHADGAPPARGRTRRSRRSCRSAPHRISCSTATSSTIPIPRARRSLLDDAGDGSAYSKLHEIYHPLMRTPAATLNFSDFLMVEPKSGRIL